MCDLIKIILSVVIVLGTGSFSLAEEGAGIIRTSGAAEIEKVKNYIAFSSSQKFSITLPEVISAGKTITIRYVGTGKTENFTVVDIAIRKDLCWLHSKHHSMSSMNGDTIYMQPCQKIR